LAETQYVDTSTPSDVTRGQQVVIAIGSIVTDVFAAACCSLLLATPWRLAATVVLMSVGKEGREKHSLKSSAKMMSNAAGYGFSRMRSFDDAISCASRNSLFYSVEFQCLQLKEMCVDIVHHLDSLCGEGASKFDKASCSQKVVSSMTFIVSALRVRCVQSLGPRRPFCILRNPKPLCSM
jgi:hypothetical protein